MILQVKDIVKYYGSGTVVTKALDGISFDAEEGEFIAIMGASGSGKSTLLNIIATIDSASSGDVCIRGRHLSQMKEKELASFRRDQLGFIFQEYNLLDTLTIAENIVLPLNLKKTPLSETEQKLRQTARVLHMEEQLLKFPHELSGGQRQRAACARAVITEPALILADEPTGALDSRNSKTLLETFVSMNHSFHASILMVTHDPAAASYAERILFLKDGKIFSETCRGSRARRELYQEIISVTAALGGETDAVQTCY